EGGENRAARIASCETIRAARLWTSRRRSRLIQVEQFVAAPYGREVAHELFAPDHYRRTVVVGVERVGVAALQCPVEKEVYAAVRVVDEPEGRDRSGPQAEQPLHALFRSESQLALSEPLFEGADRE